MATTTTRRGWIHDWDPEDPARWEGGEARIARKNLALSMFAEHVGFVVWVMWTVVVLNLANMGIDLSVSQLFVLTLLPNLIGSLLRIPYTFAVPRFGGRAWTTFSAALLVVPVLLLAVVVPSPWLAHLDHSTRFVLLALCAATSGVGGGNFASSMANISHFYPESRKGWALGLNAAGGNLGVATSQLLIPLVVTVGVPAAAVKMTHHRVHMAYAGWFWLPFVVTAAFLAWRHMDSLTQARADRSSYVAAAAHPHTWVLSLLYVGTFGSFIGFSFALPLVIKTSFPSFLAAHPFIATYLGGLGFLGALFGSVSRPLGGKLADRVGGAYVTLGVFGGMAGATGVAIAGVESHSFGLFMGSFLAVFVLSGIGNGSTYKLIPAVLARRSPGVPRPEVKRRVAAVIGIAGAVGALGGVAVQVVIRQASLGVSTLMAAAHGPDAKAAVAAAHASWSAPALWTFIGAYVVLAGVTWAVYIRQPAAAAEPTPGPAAGMATA